MNRLRLRKKQREEKRKPRDWHRKLQGGCTVKRKEKEKLPKKQLRNPKRQKKQLEKQLKKRRESSMRSYKSRKQRG